MTYKVGDVVEVHFSNDIWFEAELTSICNSVGYYEGFVTRVLKSRNSQKPGIGLKWAFDKFSIQGLVVNYKNIDAINPNYYILPNGRELQELSGWLTSNGGQAVQYVFRSSRIDGIFKQDTTEGRIEDLDKAIKYCEMEIARLKGDN